MERLDPGTQQSCPKCGKDIEHPDIREIDNPALLDYHCPHCGYHYARWPKNPVTTEEL